MITMRHFRRSTPTAGLEVIMDLTILNGNTGCGFSLVQKLGNELTILAEDSSYLGTDASVFQVEVTAIHGGAMESALQVSVGLLTESIAFKSDSRAALLAISNPLTSSKLVRATQDVLNSLTTET